MKRGEGSLQNNRKQLTESIIVDSDRRLAVHGSRCAETGKVRWHLQPTQSTEVERPRNPHTMYYSTLTYVSEDKSSLLSHKCE